MVDQFGFVIGTFVIGTKLVGGGTPFDSPFNPLSQKKKIITNAVIFILSYVQKCAIFFGKGGGFIWHYEPTINRDEASKITQFHKISMRLSKFLAVDHF